MLYLLSYFLTKDRNYKNKNVETLLMELSKKEKWIFLFEMRGNLLKVVFCGLRDGCKKMRVKDVIVKYRTANRMSS